MSTRRVCDASAVVALLLDAGPEGRWAAQTLADADLAAPTLVLFEVANIIRRHELAGFISADQAVQAHTDLVDLTVEPWPYEVLARRAWELRRNLTIYDASCVACAELCETTLVTLDRVIAGAPGVRCPIATPPS